MPIDFSKMKSRATSAVVSASQHVESGGTSSYVGILDTTKAPYPLTWWKPDSEAKNWEMDILAYPVENPKNPVVRNEGMVPGEDWHFHIPVTVHKRLAGSMTDMICLKSFGLPCPACDAFFEFHNEHNKPYPAGDSRRRDNPYSATPRSIMLVRPRNKNPDDKIFLFDAPAGLKPTPGFLPMLLAAANSTRNGTAAVDFAHPESGAVVQFDTSAGAKKGHYPAFNFGFRPRPKEEGLALWKRTFALDKLLIIPTADEMKALLYGAPEEEDSQSSRSTQHTDPDDAPDTQETRRQHDAQPENPVEDGKWKAPEQTQNTGSKCPSGLEYGKSPLDEPQPRPCRNCAVFEECMVVAERGYN